MGNNRVIIRLIDVAFIILFGFIGISGIKTEYVELPSGSDPTKNPKEFQEVDLRIHPGFFQLSNNSRRQNYTSLPALEGALLGLREGAGRRNAQLMVNIECNRAVLMQELIDVIDLCQRNQIQKNLTYAVFQ